MLYLVPSRPRFLSEARLPSRWAQRRRPQCGATPWARCAAAEASPVPVSSGIAARSLRQAASCAPTAAPCSRQGGACPRASGRTQWMPTRRATVARRGQRRAELLEQQRQCGPRPRRSLARHEVRRQAAATTRRRQLCPPSLRVATHSKRTRARATAYAAGRSCTTSPTARGGR